MRNLKRALSLTLASVMLLGMMVLGTSAAAAYPDVTDEHNVEAIEVLQAIGVMSGSNSGNFNPDSKVTRIEMAIVMANLLDLDVDYFQGQNQFSDVPAWASGYVNACAASGIVSGVGGGRFGTGNVTATQAALMMLKALGYFQYNSDFNGDWARATALQASRIGLFKDIKAQDNTQLDRNQVAQLALNTLESTMVDAEDNTLHITTGEDAGNLNISGGSVKYIVRTSDDNKIGKAIRTGTAAGGTSSSQLNGQTLELGEQLYQGDLVKKENNPSASPAVVVTDEFGRPATRWTFKGREIGTYSVAADLTYTKEVKLSDIYKDLNLGSALAAGKVDFVIDGKTETDTTNGKIQTNGGSPADLDGEGLNRSNDNKIGGKGALTQVFYDKDADKATVTVVNSYLVKVTGNYSTSDEELNVVVEKCTLPATSNSISLTLSSDDFEGLENYSDGDRLVVTISNDGINGTIESVRPAEKVTAVAKSYIVNDSVTMDTQKYEYSAKYDDKGTVTYTVDNSYDLYLDPYGYILLANAVEAEASEYVFIKETKDGAGLSVGGNVTAAAYFTDGTFKPIPVSKVDGVNATQDSVTDQWCTFIIRDDKYELTIVTSNVKGGGTVADGVNVTERDKITINAGAAVGNTPVTSKATSATIFVTRDNNSDNNVKAYTGISNVPTITSKTAGLSKAYVVENDNGFAKYVFIELNSAEVSKTNTSDDVIYILSTSGVQKAVDEDKNTYYRYKAIVNGVEKRADAQNDTSVFTAVGLYTDIEYDDDGYVKKATLLDTANTAVSAKFDGDFFVTAAFGSKPVTEKDNVVSVAGVKDFGLAKDAKIYRIKADDSINFGVSTSTLAADYSAAKGGLSATIYGVIKDGLYTELYIDLGQGGSPSVDGVTVTPTTLSVAKDGTATFTVTDANANKTVTIGANNGNVTVSPTTFTNQSGAQTITVTGVAEGTANVTVTVDGQVAGKVAVTVTPPVSADQAAVNAAIAALESKTGSDITLAAQDSAYATLNDQNDAAKTKVAGLVTALSGTAAGVAVDDATTEVGFSSGYKFAAAGVGDNDGKAVINGVDTGDAAAAAGTDGQSVVTVALKKGEATGTATIKIIAKAQAFKDNATASAAAGGKLDAGITVIQAATAPTTMSGVTDEKSAGTVALADVKTAVEAATGYSDSTDSGNVKYSYTIKENSYNEAGKSIVVTVTVTWKETGLSKSEDVTAKWA